MTAEGETLAVGASGYSRVSMWVRDVTEEGIKPHPGPYTPRVLTKNLDSLVSRFESTMFTTSREHARHPIRALFIQDPTCTYRPPRGGRIGGS